MAAYPSRDVLTYATYLPSGDQIGALWGCVSFVIAVPLPVAIS